MVTAITMSFRSLPWFDALSAKKKNAQIICVLIIFSNFNLISRNYRKDISIVHIFVTFLTIGDTKFVSET